MNCTSFDLKAFFLGELAPCERRTMEDHLRACTGCREELERLRLTQAALAELKDEEVPRRIAFVSDKVFEPGWWQAVWRPGPQWAMLAAGLVAAAILVHGWVYRPVAAGAVDARAIETRVQAEVGRRLPEAVDQAVATVEARQQVRVQEAVAAIENKAEFARKAQQVALEETLEVLRKQYNVMYLASARLGGDR